MLSSQWQPMQEMNRLRHEMDRLFGNYGGERPRDRGASVFPALNVWEDDDNYFVEAELPGFGLEELEIYVTGGNELSISGERKPLELEGGAWHRQERGFGKFRRTLDLPGEVKSDGVSATLKYGVLTISLPKSEEVKPRRIKVTAN